MIQGDLIIKEFKLRHRIDKGIITEKIIKRLGYTRQTLINRMKKNNFLESEIPIYLEELGLTKP